MSSRRRVQRIKQALPFRLPSGYRSGPHQRTARPDRAEGQVLILFALMLLVLVGFMALAIDVGYLVSERRQVQSASDAAAMAGAQALLDDNTGQIAASAESYGAINAGVAAGDVEVSQDDECVAVTIPKEVERFFLGAIYTGEWSVSATARACTEDVPQPYALLALDEDENQPGISLNGTTSIVITDGSAISNDDVVGNGKDNDFGTDDGTIDANGTIIRHPAANWGETRENQPIVTDPLDGVAPPSTIGLEVFDESDQVDCMDSGSPENCTLEPGHYQNLGNIEIKRTASLISDGTYYFDNTSISLGNDKARIEGDNVLLYFTGNTNEAYFDPKNGEVALTAGVTTGSDPLHEDIAVWISKPNCSPFDSQGDGEFYIEGMFYAPCSFVSMHGNPGGEAINGQVIVGDFEVKGSSDFLVQYDEIVQTERPEVFLVQ